MLINSVFLYGKGETPALWSFTDHRPTFTRVYYILGGTAYYRDSERELPLEVGKLYFLPADRTYSLWEEESDKLRHLYLHLMTTPKLAAPVVCDPGEDRFLRDTLALLLSYVEEGENAAAIRRLTEALALYVLGEGQTTEALPLRIRSYLDACFREPFSAERMARRFGYSASYLYKAFKRDFGLSPKQYHADRRFEYASECLSKGTPATEIAEALAYTSLSNFSRDFKKRFGLGPSEYARQLPK